ncbi:acyl-CoA-binding protein (ACBP)/diazepam binding inhibitor (DBI)/endozepine (EP) [Coemansia helicoidea]|uniref:Acyl-CoA-binding protein (ACBP)/diazepam binding inhibitor (DBI)/endozepine (EP) n=1 Tax=Coemansia helicoidea TaxID=1286919 RepID=A0ACC1KUY9_9FUNG|nr:acyl-CoA-binding protein (ACBP)/diazepam binding inhibitor (DBI)/endozepine (EP) [Coemansia helicoidea]
MADAKAPELKEATPELKEVTPDLKKAFETAAEDVKELPKAPSQDEQLTLYGLFKQANEGDNTKPKPGMFDLKAKYKWEAYEKLKGKAEAQAMKEYIDFVKKLQDKA